MKRLGWGTRGFGRSLRLAGVFGLVVFLNADVIEVDCAGLGNSELAAAWHEILAGFYLVGSDWLMIT